MSASLQQIYEQCCDEEWERCWYGRPVGYQVRNAEEAGRRIGRKVIEEASLYRLLDRLWPEFAHDGRMARERVRALKPSIIGYNKQFYIFRDVAKALRGIERRPACSMCGRRFDRHWESDEGDQKWRPTVFTSDWRVEVPRWTCSMKCYRKAQRQADKEIAWIKTANQRIKEARAQIRDVGRNPVARQSSGART